MTQSYITFKLNSNQSIKFILPCKKEEVFLTDEININFCNDKIIYSIYEHDCISYSLRKFINSLKDAINTQLQLHESIQQNIGFLWHNYLHSDGGSKFVEIEYEGQTFWIGERYLLWTTKKINTWLYNKNEKIILELTPSYPWHFADPEDVGTEYFTFAHFINEYKSILIVEIDKCIAINWLAQAEELLELSIKNFEALKKSDTSTSIFEDE